MTVKVKKVQSSGGRSFQRHGAVMDIARVCSKISTDACRNMGYDIIVIFIIFFILFDIYVNLKI